MRRPNSFCNLVSPNTTKCTTNDQVKVYHLGAGVF